MDKSKFVIYSGSAVAVTLGMLIIKGVATIINTIVASILGV